jgi:hypothetical protein
MKTNIFIIAHTTIFFLMMWHSIKKFVREGVIVEDRF